MANFVNSSTIGVQLGNSDGATALFAPGQHVLGNNNSEWIYVCAAAAATTGQMMCVGLSFTANLATATLISGSAATIGPQRLAFAQGVFAASDFGWIAVRGDALNVALSSSSTMGLPLYLGTSSGSITTVTATITLAGILCQAVSATAVVNPATTAFVTWPRVVQLGSGALG